MILEAILFIIAVKYINLFWMGRSKINVIFFTYLEIEYPSKAVSCKRLYKIQEGMFFAIQLLWKSLTKKISLTGGG